LDIKKIKKIRENLIKKYEAEIEATEFNLEELKLKERFLTRQTIKTPNTNHQITLGKIQEGIKNLQKLVKLNQEFIDFIKEVEKEETN